MSGSTYNDRLDELGIVYITQTSIDQKKLRNKSKNKKNKNKTKVINYARSQVIKHLGRLSTSNPSIRIKSMLKLIKQGPDVLKHLHQRKGGNYASNGKLFINSDEFVARYGMLIHRIEQNAFEIVDSEKTKKTKFFYVNIPKKPEFGLEEGQKLLKASVFSKDDWKKLKMTQEFSLAPDPETHIIWIEEGSWDYGEEYTNLLVQDIEEQGDLTFSGVRLSPNQKVEKNERKKRKRSRDLRKAIKIAQDSDNSHSISGSLHQYSRTSTSIRKSALESPSISETKSFNFYSQGVNPNLDQIPSAKKIPSKGLHKLVEQKSSSFNDFGDFENLGRNDKNSPKRERKKKRKRRVSIFRPTQVMDSSLNVSKGNRGLSRGSKGRNAERDIFKANGRFNTSNFEANGRKRGLEKLDSDEMNIFDMFNMRDKKRSINHVMKRLERKIQNNSANMGLISNSGSVAIDHNNSQTPSKQPKHFQTTTSRRDYLNLFIDFLLKILFFSISSFFNFFENRPFKPKVPVQNQKGNSQQRLAVQETRTHQERRSPSHPFPNDQHERQPGESLKIKLSPKSENPKKIRIEENSR